MVHKTEVKIEKKKMGMRILSEVQRTAELLSQRTHKTNRTMIVVFLLCVVAGENTDDNFSSSLPFGYYLLTGE